MFFILLLLLKFSPSYSQNVEFKLFQQFCLCNTLLFNSINSDSILNLSIIRENILSIDIITSSTCFTKHLGGVNYSGNTLRLIFRHESTPPPENFQIIGYKPNDIVEVADCESNFLFGFTIYGIKQYPDSIFINGRHLAHPAK